MRILLLANPRARSGDAARRLPMVLDALRSAGGEVTHLTVAPTVTADVAERLAGDCERVVALGGDGTFASVADAVLDAGSDIPLALLPAGLANNHARGLGVPTIYDDLRGAVDQVFADGRRSMDVGLLDGARFYDTVGFGFQAASLVRRERLRHRQGLGGELGYAMATALELAHPRGSTGGAVTITVDGRTTRWARAVDVVVSNSVWYGGRWVLDPRCRIDDGILEVVVVRGWRDLIRHGLRSVGTADARGAMVELAFERPVRTQVDGEVGPVGAAFTIEVQPRALCVVAPRPH